MKGQYLKIILLILPILINSTTLISTDSGCKEGSPVTAELCFLNTPAINTEGNRECCFVQLVGDTKSTRCSSMINDEQLIREDEEYYLQGFKEFTITCKEKKEPVTPETPETDNEEPKTPETDNEEPKTPETDNEETNKVSDSESDTDQANNEKGITLTYILIFLMLLY